MKKVIFLFILSLVPAFQTLSFNFTFDDFPRLVENPRIKNIINIKEYFSRATWPGNLFRPIEEFSYSSTYAIAKLNPSYYHLVNILIHALVCISIFFLIKELFDQHKAFLISILFALHPLHSEVIANISYRTESLATLFIILALIAALKQKKIIYMLLFLLALISKESGIHLLFLTPLVLWRNAEDKTQIKKYLLLCIVPILVYSALRYNALDGKIFIEKAVKMHDNPLIKIDPGVRILNSISLLGRYAFLSFVPFHLSAVSSFPKMIPFRSISLISNFDIFQISFLLIIIFFAFKSKEIKFWLLWFIFSLLITSNLIMPIGTIFADRLAYLASLFACGIIVEICYRSLKKPHNVVYILASLFLILSYKNIAHWRDNYTLFAHEVINSPRASIAHRIYGKELLVRNKSIEAIKHLKVAKELYPFCLRSPKLLSLAYLEQGQKELAKKEALETLKHLPQDKISKSVLTCIHFNKNCVGLIEKYL